MSRRLTEAKTMSRPPVAVEYHSVVAQVSTREHWCCRTCETLPWRMVQAQERWSCSGLRRLKTHSFVKNWRTVAWKPHCAAETALWDEAVTIAHEGHYGVEGIKSHYTIIEKVNAMPTDNGRTKWKNQSGWSRTTCQKYLTTHDKT